MKAHDYFTREIILSFFACLIFCLFFINALNYSQSKISNPEEVFTWMCENDTRFPEVSEKLKARYGKEEALVIESVYLNYYFSSLAQRNEIRYLYQMLGMIALVIVANLFCPTPDKKTIGMFKLKLLQAKGIEQHLRRTLYEYLNNVKETIRAKVPGFSRRFTCDDTWKRVFTNVDFVFKDFTLRLKLAYPGITDEQLKLCCLILTGADTTEIAQQLDISKVNVRQRKNRLRGTMGIKHKNLDLRAVLQEF